MQLIELATGRIEQYDSSIFVVRPKAAIELSAEDIRQYVNEMVRRASGPAYVLVDRRSGYSLNFGAQEFLRKEVDRYLAAVAYVAHPGTGLAVAELTSKLMPPGVQSKAFLTEEEALAWLLQLRG